MPIDYFGYHHPLIRVKTFFSLKARRKMFSRFTELYSPDAATKVLDLGTTPDMKLDDSNYFVKQYPWKNITLILIRILYLDLLR